MTLSTGRLGLLLVAAGLVIMGSSAAAVYAQSATTVVMQEFVFNPDRLVLPAGRDTITLQNTGQFPHNLHIEGNGVSVDVQPNGNIDGGQSFTGTVTLAPGTYDMWCPVPTHRERGMVGTLTVAAAAAGGAAQVPAALPRTGETEPGFPVAQASIIVGLVLVGAGWYTRRRAHTATLPPR